MFVPFLLNTNTSSWKTEDLLIRSQKSMHLPSMVALVIAKCGRRSVISLSCWLIKSTRAYLTMENAMKMPVVEGTIRFCRASVGVNENETTLLLSANYCHIRVRSTEAELIYMLWPLIWERSRMRAHEYLIMTNRGQSTATTTKSKSIASTNPCSSIIYERTYAYIV